MRTEIKKEFDTVAYFRAVKEALAARMKDMTLAQQREFMQQVRNKEIKIDLKDTSKE